MTAVDPSLLNEGQEYPVARWSPAQVPNLRAGPAVCRHDIVDPDGALLPINSLLLRRPGSDTLVVHLHALLDRQKYTLPRFERLTSLRDLPHHLLFITDPTLYLDPTLRIAWYIGNARDNVTDRLAAYLREVSYQLGVEKIVIAGSSAGGYGALALAPRVPGSLGLAFSPQTNIGRFFGGGPARSLIKAAFPEFESYEQVEATHPERVDLSVLYDRMTGGRAWYVQNTGDDTHVVPHMQPFRDSVDDRVTFVLEHHCQGHNPPTSTRVRGWIEHACENYFGDPLGFRLGGGPR